MGGILNAKPVSLYSAVVLVVLAGGLPLGVMVSKSLWIDGRISLANYSEVLGSANIWVLFGNSLMLASFATLVAGLVGVPLGVLFAKTDLPGRMAFTFAFSLPLIFPPYVLAGGWFEILGRGGILTRWAGPMLGDFPSRLLFGLPGAILVLATAFLPMVLLLTVASLRSVNPRLEEAARFSYPEWGVVRRISVPLAGPAILLSLILVFLLSIGEFGASSFLRVSVLPVATFVQFSAFYNFGAAAAASLPMLLVVGVGLVLERHLLGSRIFQFRLVSGRDTRLIPLGRSKPWLFALTTGFAGLWVALPLAALVSGGANLGALSEAVARAGDSALRSLLYASTTATLLTVDGFLLGYTIQRKSVAWWRSVDAFTLSLFTLPGTVVGTGLIVLWNHPSTNFIYATPAWDAFDCGRSRTDSSFLGRGCGGIRSAMVDALALYPCPARAASHRDIMDCVVLVLFARC